MISSPKGNRLPFGIPEGEPGFGASPTHPFNATGVTQGYKEMPDKMYAQWLQGIFKEKDKYSNKKLTGTMHGK
jgi:hypothetical protein